MNSTNRKTSKTVCALLYLEGQAKTADRLRISRLLYLADKYHFMSHKETITGDRYVALGIGPAGVRTMIIFNAWTLYAGMFDKTAISSLLSLTEKHAMDHVVQRFAGMSDKDLEAYMLTLPEWTVARKLFDVKASLTGTHSQLGPDGQLFFPIELEDLLLKNDDDPYFNMTEELEQRHRETAPGRI